MGTLPDSTLIARKLHQIKTHYGASLDFLACHGPISRPEDLAPLPLITGSVDHWTLKRGQDTRLIHVSNGLKIISGRTMRLAALEGLSITRLAYLYVERDLAAGRLLKLLPDWSEDTP